MVYVPVGELAARHDWVCDVPCGCRNSSHCPTRLGEADRSGHVTVTKIMRGRSASRNTSATANSRRPISGSPGGRTIEYMEIFLHNLPNSPASDVDLICHGGGFYGHVSAS